MNEANIMEELEVEVAPLWVDKWEKIRPCRDFPWEGLHVITVEPDALRLNHSHD